MPREVKYVSWKFLIIVTFCAVVLVIQRASVDLVLSHGTLGRIIIAADVKMLKHVV